MANYMCPENICPVTTVCPITGPRCVTCGIFNCAECLPETPDICVNCLPGHFKHKNSCQKCEYNCLLCSDSSSCTTCKPKFFLDRNQCLSCARNCELCTDANTCSQCQSKYYLNSDLTCSACSPGCNKCTDGNLCQVCLSGFSLQDGKCVKCPSKCSECTNDGICTQCNLSSVLINKACESCPAYCKNCSINGRCEICIDGYFLKNGKCTSCGAKCRICKSETECELCQPHMSVSLASGKNTCQYDYCNDINPCADTQYCVDTHYGNKCYELPDHCMVADINRACSKCLPHFVLFQGTCQKCDKRCEYCTSSSHCDNCFDGYFVGEKYECLNCSIGCANCINEKRCYKCFEGYLLENGICQKQPVIQCSSEQICPNGQYCLSIQGSSECQSCPQNCKTCVSASSCMSCKDDFVLTEEKQCIAYQSQADETCSLGQFFKQQQNGGQCQQCMENCEVCTSTDTCQTCSKNYSLNHGKCVENVNKTGQGAMVGIIICLLVIVGGVVGTAIFITQKRKRSVGNNNHVDILSNNEITIQGLQNVVDQKSILNSIKE
ncbi:Cysteine-rich membrane protein 2 [Spironucleus salmonicida]|uniref:Cysteine-rich membrane protein 2 n=1 Tax=Spironucleus salmonicida TaxID=348837 RepID=V6LYB6_9EUKA|nr:Cysteine-rich membrane protein 2 [Spironucleus salmonicida]|eukprot:EST49570.1 Cysteine-rich membrane protein 2 [Spironucleus salmonicida]